MKQKNLSPVFVPIAVVVLMIAGFIIWYAVTQGDKPLNNSYPIYPMYK